MFSVIFEVLPRKENWDDYLENAFSSGSRPTHI